MKINKSFQAYTLLLVWLLICAGLFVRYTGSVSYLHLFAFIDWATFVEHVQRVNLMKYCFDIIGALFGVLIFSLVCLSLGLKILQVLKKNSSSLLAVGISAFALGEIVYSIVFLTLLSLYTITPLLVFVMMVFGFLIGFSALISFLRSLKGLSLSDTFVYKEKIIVGLIVSVVVLGLLYTSSRLGYDSVSVYFSNAKFMAVSQHAQFLFPKDRFTVSSFHAGILFTAIMQTFGDQAARMLSWVNGLAILLLGLAVADVIGLSSRARIWFSVLMVTSTAYVDLLGDGKIELISTVPILAAVYWMLKSVERPSKSIFLLIGLFVGFSIISRPYNMFLLVLFIMIFYIVEFYKLYRDKQFHARQLFNYIFWLLPTLLSLVFFHLFQNWIWLDNPFAPVIYANDLKASNWQWQFDPVLLNLYRLFYPFVVTIINSPQSLGSISPLFIGFVPGLLSKNIRQAFSISPSLKRLLISVVVTLLLWIFLFFTVVEIRYVLFLWVLLFLPIAHLIEVVLQESKGPLKPAIYSLIVLTLLYVNIRTLVISLDTYSPIDENKQAHCFDITLCEFLNPVNEIAEIGDRVLVLNAYRYYLRPDLFACSSRADEYALFEALARENSPDFWVEIYKKGYRYIIFEENYSVRHSRFGTIPDAQIAPDWLKISILYNSTKNSDIVYQIDALRSPVSQELTCKKSEDGIWELKYIP